MATFITAQEAAALINNNDTVVFEGFLSSVFPQEVTNALEERFISSGFPQNLTLLYAAGLGNGKGSTVDHLAYEGLIKRVVAGHWNLTPKLGKMALDNKIEAYNLPQGAISQLFRDMAAGKPGTVTHVGLKTFVDPRLDGGKLNSVTTEDIVELVQLGGKEQLFYKSQPVNCCILRGTYADEKGNISLEREGATPGSTSIAQAVRRAGGIVIAQVNRVVRAGTLHAQLVKVPHIYVDYVVEVPLEKHMPEVHPDMIDVHAGTRRIPSGSIPSMGMSEIKIIGRRGAMELLPGSAVNLGIGMPESVAAVANEEGIGDYMTLTVEAGAVGGIPVGGALFGVSVNPDAILDQAYQFDFYDGGGLDLAFLGLAECDAQGNINVSRMGSRLSGCGGFINISQNAKKVFFCGTFTAKGLEIATGSGELKIVREGEVKKFIKKVQHITYSGAYAAETGQQAFYLTERAVFMLQKDGLHLMEVAPGIDIERDILAHMEFAPVIPRQPKLMDSRIFSNALMGLGRADNPVRPSLRPAIRPASTAATGT